MKKNIYILLIGFFYITVVFAQKFDSIELQNGNIYSGKIIKESKNIIVMKVKQAQLQKNTIKKVKTISRKTSFYMVKMRNGNRIMGILSRKSKGVYLVKGNPFLPGTFKLKRDQINQQKELEKIGIITQKTGLLDDVLADDDVTPEVEDNLLKRVSFFSNYMRTLNKLGNFIPSGYSFQLSYDQGLVESSAWPALRAKLAYEKFDSLLQTSQGELLGLRAELGLIWMIPLGSKNIHFLSGGFTSGAAYELAQSNGVTFAGTVFSASIFLEYSFNFNKSWGMLFQLRSSYTYDSSLYRVNVSPTFGFTRSF